MPEAGPCTREILFAIGRLPFEVREVGFSAVLHHPALPETQLRPDLNAGCSQSNGLGG